MKKGYKLSVLKGVHAYEQGEKHTNGPKFGSIQRFDFDEFENAYELDSQRKANLKESWKDYDSKYKERHHPSQFGSQAGDGENSGVKPEGLQAASQKGSKAALSKTANSVKKSS